MIRPFKNLYNIEKLDNYNELINCLKEYIKISEKYILEKETLYSETYEGVCSLFATSIIEYAKEWYDNVIMGHFHSASMINRGIIENYVCFKLISEYRQEELWKYWLIHSFNHIPYIFGEKEMPLDIKGYFNFICDKINIDKEFLDKYIHKNYGWAYKFTKKFSFYNLCKLIDKRIYNDYRIVCEYVHGTNVLQKRTPFMFNVSLLSMFSMLVVYLDLFIVSYCVENLDSYYVVLRDALYDIIKEEMNKGIVLS